MPIRISIVVCLCAAALLLPGVLGAARQAQLLGQVQPRPAVAGVPSEQARSIPLLYDLYRRQAGDPLPQADNRRRSRRGSHGGGGPGRPAARPWPALAC